MTIRLLTIRISLANDGNAAFNSESATFASAVDLKFPTRVYQLGDEEKV